MKNLKIGTRLGLGFGVVLLLMLILVIVSLTRMANVKDNFDTAVNNNYTKIATAVEMKGHLNDIIREIRNLLLQNKNPAEQQKEASNIAESRKKYNLARDKLQSLVVTEKAKAIMATIVANQAVAKPMVDQVRDLALSGKTDAAMDYLIAQAGPNQVKWLDSITSMIELQELQNKNLVEQSFKDYETAFNLLLGLGACAILFGGASAWLIMRSITRPLAGLEDVMRTMAAGDLSVAVPNQQRGDEIGSLSRAAGEMRSKLHALALGVRTQAQGVHTASQHIAGSVEEQAATSNEMSAAVAEITSTIEEMSASSEQIAEHANSVVTIATKTWENSKQGAETMQLMMSKMMGIQQDNQSTLQGMVELGGKSREISKIMKIINAIADQTKLIAFNAALEASSAGEAGRRFSVVAVEIRRLADSVTDSTLEIEAKINQIQESISELVVASEKGATSIVAGMSATSEATESMESLVDAAQQTNSAAQQISLSTQQQRTASNQVVIALREIATASSNTARSIVEIAEIAKDMTNVSSELDRQVSQFRLDSALAAPPLGAV